MPNSWGPSDQEIQHMVLSEHQPQWGAPQVFDIQADISSEEELEDQDGAELLEAFETNALTEAYHDTDELSLDFSFQGLRVEAYSGSSEYRSRGVSRSPRKRSRLDSM
jgi:hypothetical protein